MKTAAEREQALALFLNNLSWENIAKELNIAERTVRDWGEKYNWKDIREKTIQKAAEKAPDKYHTIISDQVEIGDLANKEVLKRLKSQGEIRLQVDLLFEKLKTIDQKEDPDSYFATVDAMKTLMQQIFQNRDLITIQKHVLEVVRPTREINFIQEQKNVQINPTELVVHLKRLKDEGKLTRIDIGTTS